MNALPGVGGASTDGAPEQAGPADNFFAGGNAAVLPMIGRTVLDAPILSISSGTISTR